MLEPDYASVTSLGVGASLPIGGGSCQAQAAIEPSCLSPTFVPISGNPGMTGLLQIIAPPEGYNQGNGYPFDPYIDAFFTPTVNQAGPMKVPYTGGG